MQLKSFQPAFLLSESGLLQPPYKFPAQEKRDLLELLTVCSQHYHKCYTTLLRALAAKLIISSQACERGLASDWG